MLEILVQQQEEYLPRLGFLREVVNAVVREAWLASDYLEAGSAVLFEIVSESGNRLQYPFNVRVKTATIIKYTKVW